LGFWVLRVSRTDPAERFLVRMLLATEADLNRRPGPLVFPVFGRGRALNALVGAGISEENLTRKAEFLLAACSCKVKEANPGVDLLLSADWPMVPSSEAVVDSEAEPTPIPLPTTRAPATKSAPEADSSSGGREWLYVSLAVVGVVLLVSAYRPSRRKAGR